MIFTSKMFSCDCDNCGETFMDDHSGFTAYADSNNLVQAMDSNEWYTNGSDPEHNEKYYCPKCFKYHETEDDKIIIDLSRKISITSTPDSEVKRLREVTDRITEWMAWTKVNFPKSTAESSLVHLQREIKEVLHELNADEPHPRQDNAVMSLIEYTDCIICLLTSAGKSGLTVEQLLSAIKNKIEINMFKRKWKDNGDGTYSHIKH